MPNQSPFASRASVTPSEKNMTTSPISSGTEIWSNISPSRTPKGRFSPWMTVHARVLGRR